jgi:hypothetical protein
MCGDSLDRGRGGGDVASLILPRVVLDEGLEVAVPPGGVEVELLHLGVDLVVAPAVLLEPVDRAHRAGKDSAPLGETLSRLLQNGAPRAEVDAFNLWLGFIDHGDTKTDNHKFACLKWAKSADGSLLCEEGQAVYYVSDMGSTFGYSGDSEKKARLEAWKGKDPIRVSGGRCTAAAKSVGDANVSEEGRQLLAQGLQRLLDAEAKDGLVTKVFRASRNHERDQPAEAWAADFVRKAKTIIDAKCSN